jgi:hypothetical protein
VASWTTSHEIGGTPGNPNFSEPDDPQERALIASDRPWKVFAADTPPASWNELPFDDSSWASVESPFPVNGETPLLLRKSFAYLGDAANLLLLFDGQTSESTTFYLNGEPAGTLEANGAVLLDAASIAIGANVLAVRASGQPADAEFVFDGSLSAITGLTLPEESPHPSGSIVINEIHYHARPTFADPASGVAFAKNNEEWIELLNITDEEIDLSGWRLSDGIGYSFPDGPILAPGEYLVITNDQFSGALSNLKLNRVARVNPLEESDF